MHEKFSVHSVLWFCGHFLVSNDWQTVLDHVQFITLWRCADKVWIGLYNSMESGLEDPWRGFNMVDGIKETMEINLSLFEDTKSTHTSSVIQEYGTDIL